MKEPVLDPRVRGAVRERLPAGDATAVEVDSLQGLEARLLHRIERIETALAEKLKRLHGSGVGADLTKVRDAVVEVIQSALIESGLLEKFVERAIEKRAQPTANGSATGAAPAGIAEVVQSEVRAVLSSESMKMLIDDKFRAISLYLKTDVIPKTVAQILAPKRGD